MAVPKKRTASSKRNMRRSHHGRRRLVLVACPQCTQPMVPHMACPNCGTYKGREVIDVMKDAERKREKQKAKARQ